MNYLRQSTASQSELLGPFVDDTDGTTAETGLTIANTDIRLSANGGDMAAKNSGGGTHDELGYYAITFDATDTATVGRLRAVCKMSGALVVEAYYQVLEEAVYDALFAVAAAGYNTVVPPSVSQFNARTLLAADYFDPDADTVANVTLVGATTDVTNQVSADITAISGDSSAADNLELMYNGTGYIDDTAPSSREQVGAIASSSGSGIHFEALGDNTGGAIKGVTFVGVQTGTFANTEADNGLLHTIDDTGNAIDIVYQTTLTGNRIASQIIFKGYLSSSNDVISIQAYDFIGAVWDTRQILTGQNGTANVALDIPLLIKHTGTGVESGDVLIRFVNSGQSNPQLNVDELLIEGTSNLTALGFENGAVWLDTVDGAAGTASGTGHIDTPSDNYTDARTIADNNNLKRFELVSGASITLDQNSDNRLFMGTGGTVALGGQSVSRGRFIGGTLTGIGTGSVPALVRDMFVSGVTLHPSIFVNSTFFGTFAMSDAGTYRVENGSPATTTAPVFDYTTGASESTDLLLQDWNGEVEIQSMGQSGTDTCFISGKGEITINANCTGGTLKYAGDINVIDNSGGAVTIVKGVIGEMFEDTAEIGVAGAGLTDLGGMSTAMKAEVNVEADTALTDYDGPTNAEMVAAFTEIKGATWSVTDTLENIRDESVVIDGIVDAIKVITDQFVFTVANQVDSNTLSVAGTVQTAGDLAALIGALNNLSGSDVLTQVNAALDTAIAELAVAQPAATPTLRTGLMLMYMALRNRLDVDTSGTDELIVRNNAGTKITGKLISDDGSDYSESQMS